MVTSCQYKTNLPEEESQIRLALIDFLRGLVEFDPAKRWFPFQASKHPFVTGEPFTCSYKPPSETPCMPVAQNFNVDHHPGGGHWFAAGLSPNMPDRNIVAMQISPHRQMVLYPHANSYGSVGSHGSYNKSTGLSSSYGSYRENNNMFTYYSPVGPSAMNLHGRSGISMLGSSPDARQRIMPYHPENGLVGTSPSARNFAPLPLSTSPSQFTPPSSAGSNNGHFGPQSPSRNSSHGSPLGKTAAGSHFNRRKSWGYSGSAQSQESLSSHWQGQYMDGSSAQIQRRTGASLENQGATLSLPDLGDWDPNYGQQHRSFQQHSHLEVGSPQSQDLQYGFDRKASHHVTPHFSQNSSSRLGQHHFNHGGRPAATAWGSEWNHLKVQTPPSCFDFGCQRSPGRDSFSNGMPWVL